MGVKWMKATSPDSTSSLYTCPFFLKPRGFSLGVTNSFKKSDSSFTDTTSYFDYAGTPANMLFAGVPNIKRPARTR